MLALSNSESSDTIFNWYFRYSAELPVINKIQVTALRVYFPIWDDKGKSYFCFTFYIAYPTENFTYGIFCMKHTLIILSVIDFFSKKLHINFLIGFLTRI